MKQEYPKDKPLVNPEIFKFPEESSGYSKLTAETKIEMDRHEYLGSLVSFYMENRALLVASQLVHVLQHLMQNFTQRPKHLMRPDMLPVLINI